MYEVGIVFVGGEQLSVLDGELLQQRAGPERLEVARQLRVVLQREMLQRLTAF